MDDRPRKDRLIQTRVPQDLESTLKDEARKRRLSVSHLIRNVLEDTFSLVDNVVTEVDRVVTDSVEMAQTLKRDAQRLAATARGHTAHRDPRPDGAARRSSSRDVGDRVPGAVEDAVVEVATGSPDVVAASAPGEGSDGEDEVEAFDPLRGEPTQAAAAAPEHAADAAQGDDAPAMNAGPLADVYGFQELLLNRPATCASCGAVIARGARASLGMVDKPGLARVWVCQDCMDTLAQ